MTLYIQEDPKDRVYLELIDLAFEICDEFHLVVRKNMGSKKKIEPILKRLEPSLSVMKEESEWTGTRLLNGTAEVYYYHTDENAKGIIKEVANSLYSWIQPELPEDLSFIKKGRAWLVTVSHEEESYITIDSDSTYLIDRISDIKGLKVSEE